MRRSAAHVLAACAAVLAAPAPAAAAPGLEQIQKEFKTALEKGTPATVSVLAKGSSTPCSGVVVSRSGLVLSDFDAGLVVRSPRETPGYTEQVTVRVPDMKSGAFVEYEGRIVKVLKDVDSTLIQILKPPAGGLKYLVPASAERLRVGSFTFAAGNAFGMASESLPAMTAGVVAAVTYLPDGDTSGAGRLAHVYTGAAVNPGVSGGPLLDVTGRLVGVISGCEPVAPDNPFQFLGKAVPIDRLRAAYALVPEAKDAFDEKPPPPPRADETAALETVIARAATDTYASVASLVVERTQPLNSKTYGTKGLLDLPRYLGPSSAVAVSADGWLVTSLYNLTNVVEMQSPYVPDEARVSVGLKSITRITASFADGASGEARLAAIHVGLGIALLKADVVGRRPVDAAPATAYAPGRFLVAVANPYGETPLPDPLTNFGVVSKRHGDDVTEPWRGQVQTDAGGTDGNCGAAVVDLEGRLVGIMTLWEPIQHGRNSGVAFVAPWDRIQGVLLSMKDGTSYRFPRIGIEWPRDKDGGWRLDGPPTIAVVLADGAAAKAGLQTGDVFLKVGGVAVSSPLEYSHALVGRVSGERITMTVSRDRKPLTFEVELGGRD